MIQTKAGKIYFKDGREFPGAHSRFIMTTKTSRMHTVTAGQMWDFVSSVSNRDLGLIHTYRKTRHISRRMKCLTRQVRLKFEHMLHEIPGKFHV